MQPSSWINFVVGNDNSYFHFFTNYTSCSHAVNQNCSSDNEREQPLSHVFRLYLTQKDGDENLKQLASLAHISTQKTRQTIFCLFTSLCIFSVTLSFLLLQAVAIEAHPSQLSPVTGSLTSFSDDGLSAAFSP